jgi:sulfotransferase family protein
MSGSVTSPCFVFGALRSGTTLLRLMLNSHDQISNPGEADFLFDFLRPDPSHPTGWTYDIEAMTQNRIFKAYGIDIPQHCDGLDLLQAMIDQLYKQSDAVLTLNVHRHATRIKDVLPGSKFIHLVRDPRDVARSSIGMGWAGNSYYGVRHWIETEQGWKDAAPYIPPEQVLTLKFEDLMQDIEGELKRICAFLDVVFSPKMLEYYQNTTYGPPDPKIAVQWRKKASPREIALIQGACDALLVESGYTASGPSLQPDSFDRVGLFIQNRLARWRFNLHKFGPVLFLKYHFARHFGSKTMRARIKAQMDRITIQELK